MAAFESYAPHPSLQGAYNFYPPGGGNPALFAGDAAERLKRSLDLAPQPQMLASNGMQPPPEMNPGMGLPGGAYTGGETKADVMPPNPAAAPAAPSPAVEVAGQEGRSAASPPVRKLAPQAGAQAAEVAAPTGSGPNPGDYVKMITSKPHWSPTAEKVVTENAAPPELQHMYAKAYSDSMQANASAAQATQAHAQVQLEQAKIAAVGAQKEADALEKQQIARRAALQTGADEFNRVMAVKQGELADTSKREVDQFRMYRGKTGAKIGAAIAGALGAFGSAFTGGPNFALDIINKQIDNDIQAQREEINRGVSSKQNDIQRIKDKYNVDTGVAEKLLSISLTERAQALARQQAAMQGGQEAQQKLDTFQQALAKQNLDTVNSIKDTMFGKATQTMEQKFHEGGTSAVVDPALKATAQAAGYIGQTGEGLGKGAAGAYQAQHEGTAPPKAAVAGAGQKLSARLGSTEAINESATQDMKVLEKADAGGYIAPAYHHGVLGMVATTARKHLDSAASSIVGKVLAAKGEPATEAAIHAEMERAANPNAEVREAYRKYADETLRTVHSAIERQRGSTEHVDTSAPADEQ